MVPKIKNIHRRSMTPTLVFAVKVQIFQSFGLPGMTPTLVISIKHHE